MAFILMEKHVFHVQMDVKFAMDLQNAQNLSKNISFKKILLAHKQD